MLFLPRIRFFPFCFIPSLHLPGSFLFCLSPFLSGILFFHFSPFKTVLLSPFPSLVLPCFRYLGPVSPLGYLNSFLLLHLPLSPSFTFLTPLCLQVPDAAVQTSNCSSACKSWKELTSPTPIDVERSCMCPAADKQLPGRKGLPFPPSLASHVCLEPKSL